MLRRLFTRTLFGLLIIGLAPSALAQNQEVSKDYYDLLTLPRFGASTAVLKRLGISNWNELVEKQFQAHANFVLKGHTEVPLDPAVSNLLLEYKTAADVLQDPVRKAGHDRSLISEMIKNAKNFYEILDVAKNADQNEIDFAYAQLSEILRNQPKEGQAEASALLAKIITAYATLKDQQGRYIYDTALGNRQPDYEQLLLTEGEIPPRLLLRLKDKALTMQDKAWFKTKEWSNNRLMEASGNLGFVAGALVQLCGKALVSGDPAMLKVCSDDQFDINNVLSIYAFSVGANFVNPLIKASGLRPHLAGHLGMVGGMITSHFYDKFQSQKEKKIFSDNFKEWRYEWWALHISHRDAAEVALKDATYNYIHSDLPKNPKSPEAVNAQENIEKLRQAYWARDNEVKPFRDAWLKNLAKTAYETFKWDPEGYKEVGKGMARMFATVGTIDIFTRLYEGAESKVLLANQDKIKASMPADKAARLVEHQRNIDEMNKIIDQYPELKAQEAAMEEGLAKNLYGKQIKSEYEMALDFIKGNFKDGRPPADVYQRQTLMDGAIDMLGAKIMALPKNYLPESVAIPIDTWIMQPAAKVASIPSRMRKFFLLEDIEESTVFTTGMKVRMKIGQFGAGLLAAIPGAINFLTLDQIYSRALGEATTGTELEGKIKVPLASLDDAAQHFLVAGYPVLGLEPLTQALEDYNTIWNEYRLKVILAQFNEHYSYYQKLEEKATTDVEKRIHYVLWLKGAENGPENEKDPDFIANGNDPKDPTPPWHSDPKFKATFEKEKAFYRSLITNWDDKALSDKLSSWKFDSAAQWDDLRVEAVAYLAPKMQSAYFNAQSIPILTLPVTNTTVGDHFVTNTRNAWDLTKDLFNDVASLWRTTPKPEYKRIPLPTNLQDSYIEQLNIFETFCSQVTSHLPQTKTVVNLGVICDKGPGNVGDVVTFLKGPLVMQNPASLAEQSGQLDSVVGESKRADLVAIKLAETLFATMSEIAKLQPAYDKFVAGEPEEHLPTPADQSETVKKVVSQILDSKKKSCISVLQKGTW